MGRTKRALTAVVMTGVLLGLGGAVSGGAPLGAPGEQPFHMTLEGSLPAGTGTGRFASCGDEYVERGANQTVPHIDFVAYPTVTLFPIVAVGTAPYVFASRAVTSMSLTISNLETDRNPIVEEQLGDRPNPIVEGDLVLHARQGQGMARLRVTAN